MSKLSKNELIVQKTQKLRAVLDTLPKFCLDFFRGIEQRTSLLTRINYAYDLRLYFSFLDNDLGKPVSVAKELQNVTMRDLEIYMQYLTLYYKDDLVIQNNENGIARKLSSIRSLYKYFYNKEIIDFNVTSKLTTPKIHEKPILRLTNEEAEKLLHVVNTGYGLSSRQLAYQKKTKLRDIAVFTLLLTTGIRISELCALDISDFDFKAGQFKALRKGGNEVFLYLGDEADDALGAYIEERKEKSTYSLDSPLFLSMQNKRMSVRALQELVKKYAKIAVPLKNISPHKLRSTYGTMLYQKTGDIYLVADVLGHKDVNTTKKHYAAIDEQRRKDAADIVKIKKNQ
ncbi:MAG: tyrosine-type recombinase/integrase [Clostridia bacterium]|nr:tyrosine-type recombinase/integrase [Clostridia bacterium]MBT7123001.1 tyrosine-type recombinase/integrase [Clostridia bacterium]